MIKILSYEEHPNGKKIFERYLYLAAYVLPFSPEEVIGDNLLEIHEKKIEAKNFLKVSGKTPRLRTKAYERLLVYYGIVPARHTVSYTKEERFQQDRVLARCIISQTSRLLFQYLYKMTVVNGVCEMVIDSKKLRHLLLVKMDKLDSELDKIGKIKAPDADLLLEYVFRYDKFSKSDDAFRLLMDMDVNVCPYCNRLYTTTVFKNGKKSRPQFDHYKSKSKYPYFAVSLMNLIPSCGLCNQAKGDEDELVLYPYSDAFGMDVMFETEMETGVSYLTGNLDAKDEFRVEIKKKNKCISHELDARIDKSIDLFNLKELYQHHKEYILYLFWKNYVFGEEYLEMLCEEFPEMFGSLDEAKNLMYLMDIGEEMWGSRSLGKLTHDIDAEITGKSIVGSVTGIRD